MSARLMLSYTHGRGSRTQSRRPAHRAARSAAFVLGSHSSFASVSSLRETPPATYKGLAPPRVDNTRDSIQRAVCALQRLVRQGDAEARQTMQDLVPVAACLGEYAHSAALLAAARARPYLGIAMAPDIHLFLVCAMSPNTQYEDSFVSFLRSSVVIFPAPKRFHKDVAWPASHHQSLTGLLKACLPSLLSLYPSVATKDVAFDARVSIFKVFRALLVGSHRARVAFFSEHSAVLRICILEYVYYFMASVTPMPATRYMRLVDIATLRTNAFNIGQQLRVDLNTEFAALAQHTDPWGAGVVAGVFARISDKCKVMFDRNARSGKAIMAPLRSLDVKHAPPPHRAPQKQQHELLLRECMHHVATLPFTEEFVVFEASCRRRGIPGAHMQALWSTFQAVRVFELTGGIVRAQLQAIAHLSPVNSLKTKTISSLLVCLFCCQFNLFPTFLYDIRQRTYTCNKCEIPGSAVEINMIGRVVVIMNTPLVLSVPDCCVVVWNGCYQDFTSGAEVARVPVVPWGRLSVSSFFGALLRATLPMQYITQEQADAPATWPCASVELMLARSAGRTASMPLAEHSMLRRCCMCRNSVVAQRYLLLDIHNMCMVTVCVCSRHAVAMRFINTTVVTVTDYLHMIEHMRS